MNVEFCFFHKIKNYEKNYIFPSCSAFVEGNGVPQGTLLGTYLL